METQQVGDYRLVALLGEGTVGAAYLAEHRHSGQQVAVKLLKPHALSQSEIQRRFVREVSVCEKLDHTNIVRHFDCGLHQDQIYFAMELVNSGSLKQVLQRRHALPWQEAVECAIQVCAALDHAHQAGIIHRDLKPANLFLSDDGQVKVGDFGLARDLNSTRLTVEGTTVGTCRYMPPEQISGDDNLTGAVDLYALGCILFEMLTGRTPFDGETIIEIFEHHLGTPPPRLEDIVPDCPLDLAKLVGQLLAKEPGDRPPSAIAVRVVLTNILNNGTTGTANDEDELSASNLTERLQSGPVSRRFRWSHQRLVTIAAVLSGLLILALVVWIMQ